jgi:hypothetical protein
MARIMDNMSKLWVFKADDEILVYDPDVQDPSPSKVYARSESEHQWEMLQRLERVSLWSAAAKTRDTYSTDRLRPWIRRVDVETNHAAITAYCLWLIDTSSPPGVVAAAWMSANHSTFREAAKGLIARKHNEFLIERGLPEREVRNAEGMFRHRVTHCWNCKEHLDNLFDLECSACGWIICRCGACGCGYGR